jgi:ribosomal-protein-alanine N-acetyltransferase
VAGTELRTEQLLLRRWREEDKAPFAAMNADPVVMEFFPSILTRAESDGLVDRFNQELDERRFCPWAVELGQSDTFMGFIGLHTVPDYLSFAPAVEVGWRLARPFWAGDSPPKGPTGLWSSASRNSVSTRSCRSRRWSTSGPSG